MDLLLEYFGYFKLIYGKMVLPFIIFGLILFILKGRHVLRPTKGTLHSFCFNALLLGLNSVLYALLFASVGLLSYYLYDTLGVPHIAAHIWDELPLLLVFIITLIGIDFTNYWSHRLLHTKLFWGVHSLHHSDEHMNWTTAYRVHVLEAVIMKITFIFVLGWVFLPPEMIGLAVLARGWYSKFIHCQIGWTYGQFRKLLASPNYHRWHHSIEAEAYGKNLADIFPLWDIAFGTHYDPGVCETKLGVRDAPQGFIAAQLYPFKYWIDGLLSRPASRLTKEAHRVKSGAAN